jgi:DNA-binding Lrp family transcriptional regulator
MDSTDRKLLNLLQEGFPLVPRPYAAIAAKVGLSEDETIARVKSMLSHVAQPPSAVIQECRERSLDRSAPETPPLRKIGAVLDSRALGYVSTLAAMSVPPSGIDPVAEIVNAFTGVTHNYIREAEARGSDAKEEAPMKSGTTGGGLTPVPESQPASVNRNCYPPNMWFTVHARSEAVLAAVLSEIEKRSGLAVARFDATRMFKISVRFDLDEGQTTGSDPNYGAQAARRDGQLVDWGLTHPNRFDSLSDPEHTKDFLLLKATQNGLPVCAEPYAAVGAEIGMTGDEVITRLASLLRSGIIRRIGASLAHRNAGFTANAMVAWQAPDGKIEEIGNAFAKRKEVTHCYARKTAPGWPYNLYTMVHDKSRDACNRIIASMSKDAGLNDFLILYSTRELKKTSLRLFAD